MMPLFLKSVPIFPGRDIHDEAQIRAFQDE